MKLWIKVDLFIDCTEWFLEFNIQNLYFTWIFILPSYDQSGQFLITRATEEHIFVLDARPSKLFQVLGYTGSICSNINDIMFSLFVIFYIYFLKYIT